MQSTNEITCSATAQYRPYLNEWMHPGNLPETEIVAANGHVCTNEKEVIETGVVWQYFL